MCKLCTEDPDEAYAIRRELVDFASKLDSLAFYVRNVAQGKVHPHDRSQNVIWPLVEEIKKELNRGLGL
jgi:hypothetical protein